MKVRRRYWSILKRENERKLYLIAKELNIERTYTGVVIYIQKQKPNDNRTLLKKCAKGIDQEIIP
jgi:hypothetical protein